jgi:SAM-dependent methyltransferase
MSLSESDRAFDLYVRTYDTAVPDWPGEIQFYRELVAQVRSKGGGVLEIGCGTGRVAIRLAQEGVDVVGLDLSAEMLRLAQAKSSDLPNIRWILGNMRSFELGETFDLVIIPGHAFQHLKVAEDQVQCLDCIKRHLAPAGVLVVHLDHQDIRWLGELLGDQGGRLEEAGQFRLPDTGQLVRVSRAWTYERSTQTAIVQSVWEELDGAGQVVGRSRNVPVPLHCVFRFEMEHLLARAGYQIDALYGDFFRAPLHDDSTEMIWVVRQA